MPSFYRFSGKVIQIFYHFGLGLIWLPQTEDSYFFYGSFEWEGWPGLIF